MYDKDLLGDAVIEDGNIIKITGSIEHIIYANEENGYTVCDLGTDDDDLITVTGIMPYICEGDSVILYGEWKHNPKYGRQFVVSQYERYMPANADAILRYLSSGAIKGIGKKTALKIVEEYGDETLEVLENHPDWLSDIPGISLKKAKQICEDFKAKAGIRTAIPTNRANANPKALLWSKFSAIKYALKIFVKSNRKRRVIGVKRP